APALGKARTPLARCRTRARNQVDDRQLPALAELPREPLGGMVSAFEQTVAIRRHEGHRFNVRSLNRGDDHVGSDHREPAQAVLLPPRDDRPHTLVISDRGSSRRERDAATRALGAAAHGPRGRRATAIAKWPLEAPPTPE